MSISQFDNLHREVTDPRKFLGYLLASLYFKGTDEIVVTKEQAEDDVWSAVELQASTNYDDQSWTFKFKVRGFPLPRPTPKAESQYPVMPLEIVFSLGLAAGAILTAVGSRIFLWLH